MRETDAWTLLTIAALAVVTVITRGFFLISSKPWSLPHWAQRGLQYAPIAALSAVIAPEILMLNGQLGVPWRDARVYAALAGAACFFLWRRDVFLTIVTGMAVYLPLRLLLGW